MIKAIVTDIEGTTSSISFVKDILFPYARQHIENFILANETNPEVATLLAEIRTEVGNNKLITEIVNLLKTWIDEDRKHTALKTLQGMIWKKGYLDGDYHGHIYEDAYQKLLEWYQAKIPLYIYSSGSVKAQKLLFAYTKYGDINYLFSGNFDTHTGNKKEADSYRKIAEQLNLPAISILFLSDIEAELDAASAAGYQTTQLCRPEDATVPSNRHTRVNNFNGIDLQRYQS